MKIVKKLKGIISWHFYNDEEVKSVLAAILDCANGNMESAMPILTNLFKGSDGDEIGELYIIASQDENRMYIDNEKKKIIINIRFADLESTIDSVSKMIRKEQVSTISVLDLMMIAKKEYVLQGFNQQFRAKKNKPKTDEKNK